MPWRELMTQGLLTGATALRRASVMLTAAAAGICGAETLVERTSRDWDLDQTYGLQEAPMVFAGLMEWERKLVGYLKPGGIIGIIGCGACRDLIGFARLGFTVDGLDISPRAIQNAKAYLAEAGITADLYCADIVDFTFPRECYDAFLFSWYTYSYIPHADRRVRALQSLRFRLTPPGTVILSFVPRVRERLEMGRIAHWIGRVTLNPHPPSDGDVFGNRLSYEHRFTRQEIEQEARAAGFDVVDYEDRRMAVAALKPARL